MHKRYIPFNKFQPVIILFRLADQDKYRRSKALRSLKVKEGKFSSSLPRKSITIKQSHIKMLAPEIKEQLGQLKK